MGSTPNFYYGQVPTAAQWNAAFAAKQDDLGFTPVNRAGDVMQGRLVMSVSTTARAGFNLPPGIAPNAPVDGDIWTTTAGLFYQINGVTEKAPNLTGPNTWSGLNTFSGGITGLPAPSLPSDAARLQDVTGNTQHYNPFTAGSPPGTVNYGTTAALPACTYANGTAGVGATLTANANGALPAQDGQAVNNGDLLFVWKQAAGLQNGIYVITDKGSAGTPWILTRSTAADSAAKLGYCTAVLLNGTVQANWSLQVNVATTSITVGTTALPVIVYSTNPALTSTITQVVCAVGGSGSNISFAGTPTQLGYSNAILFRANLPYAQNSVDVVANVDGLGVLPMLAEDFTAIDPLLLGGPTLFAWDNSASSPCLRVLSPDLRATSSRRQALLNGRAAQGTISSPATRYAESGQTQTGETLTISGAYNIPFGRGFNTPGVNAGDVLVAELVLGGSAGANDGLIMGGNPTAFTVDNQNLDTGARLLVWRPSGVIYVQDGTNGFIEGFSGQSSPATQAYSLGDVIRIEAWAGELGGGAIFFLWKNGNLIQTLTSTAFNFGGMSMFAGAQGVTSGTTVTINYARLCRPILGSTRRIVMDADKGSDGYGTPNNPFLTVQSAMAKAAYTADNLIVTVAGQAARGTSWNVGPTAIGMAQVYDSITFEGANTGDAFDWYGSSYLAPSSGSFTKTGGYTNVYQRLNNFNGIAGCTADAGGYIATVNIAPYSLSGGYTLPFWPLLNRTACTTATLAAALTALDAAAPGSAVLNTDTGIRYSTWPDGSGGYVNPDTLGIEEINYSTTFWAPFTDSFFADMKLNKSRINFFGADSTISEVQKCLVTYNDLKVNASLRGNGINVGGCSGDINNTQAWGSNTNCIENTINGSTIPDTLANWGKVRLNNCDVKGAITNRGATFHEGVGGEINGGSYVGCAASGLSGFRLDVFNATVDGNGGEGVFMIQKAFLKIANTIRGTTISNNPVGSRVDSNGETTGSLTVNYDGGMRFTNNATTDIQLLGSSGLPAQTVITGTPLGDATPPGAHVTNGGMGLFPGTNNLAPSPAYFHS